MSQPPAAMSQPAVVEIKPAPVIDREVKIFIGTGEAVPVPGTNRKVKPGQQLKPVPKTKKPGPSARLFVVLFQNLARLSSPRP
jgi:hypothetical protein